LRFPEFEGEWVESKIGEIVSIKSDKYNPETDELEYPCVELESLSQSTGELLSTFNSKNQKSIKNVFNPGDVLFGKLRPYLQKYYQADFEGVCSSEIWVMKSTVLNPLYLYAFVQSNIFQELTEISSGSRMPRGDWDLISATVINYPCEISEGEKIGKLFQVINARISTQNKIINDLKTLKTTTAENIFSKELRFKDENGNDFPEWENMILGDIGDVKMCRRIFNDETSPTGEIPFFKIGSFGKEADAFISKELYLDYRKRFSFPKKGDILISAAGTIGRIVVYKGEDAYYQDSNIVWIDNDNTKITNEFLYYILQIVKYNTEGGTIQRLYNNILKSTKFSGPSLSEQTKIVNFLSSIDAKNDIEAELLQKLEEQKKYLLQKMLV